jgi:hypothetical protein
MFQNLDLKGRKKILGKLPQMHGACFTLAKQIKKSIRLLEITGNIVNEILRTRAVRLRRHKNRKNVRLPKGVKRPYQPKIGQNSSVLPSFRKNDLGARFSHILSSPFPPV